MAAGPGAVVPAVLGTPPAAAANGTQRDEKKSASKTVTDTIIGRALQWFSLSQQGRVPDPWFRISFWLRAERHIKYHISIIIQRLKSFASAYAAHAATVLHSCK